jgi:hypothetical protein
MFETEENILIENQLPKLFFVVNTVTCAVLDDVQPALAMAVLGMAVTSVA